MSECVAFDISRLFIGPMNSAPRGIDRVDLGYARHFFERWNGDSAGVLPTPWGIRWFNRERSLRVINFIEDFWSETEEPNESLAYRWVKARLGGEQIPPPANTEARSVAGRLVRGFAEFCRRYGLALGQPINSLPKGTIYLNTGQITLAVPQLLRWLDTRQDIAPVFMLHDAIPIDHPEFCLPRSRRLHEQMIANTARKAAGLIVTTEAAGSSIRNALSRFGRSNLPTLVAPLPVAGAFLRRRAADAELRGKTYFVAAGAIEPRKNHLLLFNVWRHMALESGPTTPKLVLVGSRTRLGARVGEILDHCPLLKEHVIEIAGLPTPALCQLLSSARALLMPSFAEGFGLPVIEALALGTPAIASDLPSHREAAGDYATYVSSADEIGWREAIRRHATNGNPSAQVRLRAQSYRPQTWEDYFHRLQPFIYSAAVGKHR